MQTATSFERQLPARTTLAITYTNAMGLHELRSEVVGPVFLMTSSGVYRQNQVIFNVTTKFSSAISLNSYYAWNRNPGPIIGNIGSPLFGRSNQMPGSPNGEGFSENASNRRLELQLRFTY